MYRFSRPASDGKVGALVVNFKKVVGYGLLIGRNIKNANIGGESKLGGHVPSLLTHVVLFMVLNTSIVGLAGF